MTQPIHVLYGTETYNAEGLAQRTVESFRAAGFESELWDLDDVSPNIFEQMTAVCIITSTFGEGEPPSNAERFFEWLMGSSVPMLPGLSFTVCALGDSDYEHFCQCGRDIDRRLEELGGRRFAPRVDCDVDYEAPWESWLNEALRIAPNLELTARSRDAEAPELRPETAKPPRPVPKTGSHRVAPIGSRKNPFSATVLDNRNMNLPGSNKETRHIAFSLGDSGITYQVGDSLGLFPRNCPDLVRWILVAAGISRSTPVQCDGDWYSIRDVLVYRKDIMQIDHRLLSLVRDAVDQRLQATLYDKEKAREYVAAHHVLDCVSHLIEPLAPDALVGALRPLAPRLYSIASSPHAYPGEVHLTVDVLRYDLHGTARKGVASTFLAERAGPGVEVSIFIKENKAFRLADEAVPIIMIGPGTGIAPFRGFLLEREALGASGQSWLFFGSQHEETDFLYRDELIAWTSDGLLARLDTAWSRDQRRKIYVQDRLYEQRAAVYRWLEAGATIYVCGDASRMAKDVHRCLLRIIEDVSGRSARAAQIYLETLTKAGRYLLDVY